MKCRLKYSLKIIFIFTMVSFLFFLKKQMENFPFQMHNIFNSRHISVDDHSFFESAFRPSVDNLKLFDRRLTESQLSNILFKRQGNFTLPSLYEIYRETFDRPSNFSALPIFPHESQSEYDDRIWNQMRYVPEHIHKDGSKFKHILLYYGLNEVSNESFSQCPVKKCFVTGDPDLAPNADVILWMHSLSVPKHRRPFGQIWALYLLESPFHTAKFPDFRKLGANYSINWTATYRHESTLVTPYFKYTPYDFKNKLSNQKPKKNFSKGKTKLIAWFVSNCGSLNSRLQVVEELQKYIQVDIYGLCGPLKCSRDDYKSCFEMLSRDYKFYLAFENSNCRDYITEKFFLNGLSNDVLPVVMGAPVEDYQRVAPPHSFIHIDKFESLKDLAKYLHYLDKEDSAYNDYFSWKGHGLVDTNSFFWCRLCMLSHESDLVKSDFSNVYDWWFDKTKCTYSSTWTNVSIKIS